jgi:hypothetical protein
MLLLLLLLCCSSLTLLLLQLPLLGRLWRRRWMLLQLLLLQRLGAAATQTPAAGVAGACHLPVGMPAATQCLPALQAANPWSRGPLL